MLLQVKGVWFMVAKPKPSVKKRVADKIARRECLVPDCTEEMVVRGLCRSHYDAAEQTINQQPDPQSRARAAERLVTQGLILEAWQQPRRNPKGSKAKLFQEAVA
jgi:hypothetical protein